MEKTISEIVNYALSKTKDLSNCDRYTILDEVSGRLWQEADKAMEEEYFMDASNDE